MEDIIGIIMITLGSYLVGSISFATIFSKKMKGIDPKDYGSKNAGATNVLRVAGFIPAILTLFFDVLKGVIVVLVAVFLARWTQMNNGYLLPQIASISVVLGHMYPIYYKFKGGKGIATGIGVIFVLNYKIGLIVLVFALMIMIISKYVSLGSISAVILFFVLSIFLKDSFIINGPTFSFAITAFIMAFFMILKHRDNINRLKVGEENKISFKKKNEN